LFEQVSDWVSWAGLLDVEAIVPESRMGVK
jgi:hypothetical protein